MSDAQRGSSGKVHSSHGREKTVLCAVAASALLEPGDSVDQASILLWGEQIAAASAELEHVGERAGSREGHVGSAEILVLLRWRFAADAREHLKEHAVQAAGDRGQRAAMTCDRVGCSYCRSAASKGARMMNLMTEGAREKRQLAD